MADVYQSFLRSPNASALAQNASLHYITTTTSIHESSAIIKHLQAQEKLLNKKDEKVLSVIESNDGVCVETETTFEFTRGGGAILPQLDDNMLADMVVVCPMVHVVHFDGSRQITQIRLHWDQATMLKQVEAIGKTGRNWPIRDGKAQTKLVADSVAKAGQSGLASSSRPTTASQSADDVAIRSRPQSSKSNEARRAPEELWAHPEEARRQPNESSAVAPRNSAKPAPRQWGELFVGDESAEGNGRSGRDEGTALKAKAGAGKNFGANRLFDEHESGGRERSPERKKTDPSKYNHFEFGNGEDAARPKNSDRPSAVKSKPQWDFEGFNTPEKVHPKHQPGQERHFQFDADGDAPSSPPKRPIVHHARPDAGTHFTLTDDSSEPESRPISGKGRPGVFNNQADETKEPLSNITNNVNNSRRGQDFGPHFDMKDESPATRNQALQNENQSQAKNTRDDLEQHWGFGSPIQEKKIYKTAGNGMGGRAGADSLSNWMLGEEEAPKSKKIYKTAGNGMGGRKDTGMLWGIGDDDPDAKSGADSSRRGNAPPSRRAREFATQAGAEDDYDF